MEITGTVSKVAVNDWGKSKLHSFQLEEYPNEWFRTGEKELGFKEGETIKFEKVGAKIDPEKVTKIKATEITPPSQTRPEVKSQTAPRQNYWDKKAEFEAKMQPVWDWGRARSDAAVVLGAAISSGALTFPEKAARAKRLELLTDMLHNLTEDLLEKEEEISEQSNLRK